MWLSKGSCGLFFGKADNVQMCKCENMKMLTAKPAQQGGAVRMVKICAFGGTSYENGGGRAVRMFKMYCKWQGCSYLNFVSL
jgi:hypothetical protein